MQQFTKIFILDIERKALLFILLKTELKNFAFCEVVIIFVHRKIEHENKKSGSFRKICHETR